MKQHANATLTVAKCKQVKLLFERQQLSITELTRRFQVHRDTIHKWINRTSPLSLRASGKSASSRLNMKVP